MRDEHMGRITEDAVSVPEVMITVQEKAGGRQAFRVIPDLLRNPVLGTYLPNTLGEFAAVLAADGRPRYSIRSVQLGG